MPHSSLESFLSAARSLPPGPCALILCEDGVEIASTLDHHLRLGFASVILLTDPDLTLNVPLDPRVHHLPHGVLSPDALPRALNALMRPLAGRWLYAGYNAEYLFYPFCETRSISELLAFHSAERRAAMVCQVIDLYARDLAAHPTGVARQDAWFDRTGYAARPREDPDKGWAPKDRQVDLYGGLRWRFEDHVPFDRRRIDRTTLVQAKAGRMMAPDYTWSEDELNTIACPWHNSLTAAVVSFRTAKALRHNPGPAAAIDSFHWPGSVPFTWTSQQLMDLGLIEPGQWF